MGVHGHGREDTPETSWLRFCSCHVCTVRGTSVLSGARPVVPALPHGCCFGEGMRRGPVCAGAWECACAPGVGAHRAGGVRGGVWGDVQAHAGPAVCTPARVRRARGTDVCVYVYPGTASCASTALRHGDGGSWVWGRTDGPGWALVSQLMSLLPTESPAALGAQVCAGLVCRGRSSQGTGVGARGDWKKKWHFFCNGNFFTKMEIF